jgi:hypothetical protein
MSKSITIRVAEETYERYAERAKAEGTTVTALVTEAVERDPRLSDPASLLRAAEWARQHAAEFAAHFPDEEPPASRSGGRAA